MVDQLAFAQRAGRARAAAFAIRALRHPAMQIPLGALVLCAPLLINGRPFPFEDTSTYFQAGYRVLHAFFPHAGAPTSDFMRAYLGARSPSYGLLITLAERVGTLWTIVALHAVMAALLLRIVVKATTGAAVAYPILIGLLTAATSLPLFIGFLTPDVTAAFTPLCIAALTLFPDRLAKWEKWALSILFALTLSFHATHFLTAIVLLPVALIGARMAGAADLTRRARLVLAPILAAALFGLAVDGVNELGAPRVHAPPYLTARALADGPGRLYLNEACAADATRFALCAYRALPLNKSDQFLWSLAPGGVFARADSPTRLKLVAEQPRFVLGAIARYPLMEASAALRNTFDQLVTIRIDGAFAIDAEFWRRLPSDFYLADMIQRAGCPPSRTSCPPVLDLRVLSTCTQMVVVLALLYLIASVASRRPWRSAQTPDDAEYRRFAAMIAIVICALVINAALCGAISGVFPRYQARMSWLIPAIALLIETRFPLQVRALLRRAPNTPVIPGRA